MTFDLAFGDQINFLTGINGSGKTTILNSIIALITPSLEALANLQYQNIQVEFTEGNISTFINAMNHGDRVRLGLGHLDDVFEYATFVPDNATNPGREDEAEREYYKSISALSTSNVVLDYISSLPTPMFLGLDRRVRTNYMPSRLRAWAGRALRPSRNVFRGSLLASISDAASLAEQKHRDNLIAAGSVGDELRRELILELLDIRPVETPAQLQFPGAFNEKEITKIKTSVQSLHEVLNLPRAKVEERIYPFIEMLEKSASVAQKFESARRKNSTPDSETVEMLLFWNFNRSHLERIDRMSQAVTKYNEVIRELQAPSRKYLSSVNRFLEDGNKKLIFDEKGYIGYSVSWDDNIYSMDTLSSGEAQIFVILTHLWFNPGVQGGNVFIIDEPELSLHIQWQELFVDAVTEANPAMQFIMATHSPSIIMERIDDCIELPRASRS
ncbi:MAG: AAA family ATPase [Geminicoccaceae bacterium]